MAQAEALLQDILTELKAMRSGSGGGLGAGDQALESGKLVTALKSLQSAVVNTAGSILNLSTTAASGAVGVSNVLDGFNSLASKLPGLGGAVALLTQAMTIAVGITEKNVSVYKDISSSGASFGGSLVQLRQSAMSTYMTMDEFAGLMKRNSVAFSKMGGTVDDGARAFVNAASSLQKSQAGDQLRALGFTSEQLNQGLSDYILLTGGRTAKEMQNTAALTQGATQYLEQLDGLAKLTGESREALAAKMKEESANAAWESYLLTLDEEGRKKANAARLEAEARGGKGAAQALQAKLMGLPPMTEAAQKFVGTMANGNQQLDSLADSVTDNRKSVDDVKKSGAAFSQGLAQDGKNLKQVGSAMIMAGKDADLFGKAIGAANQAQRNNVKTVEEQIAFEKKLADEQKKQRNSEASNWIRFQTLLQDVGNRILNFLMPAFTFLSTTLLNVTTYLIKFMEPFLNFSKTFIKDVLGPFFTKIFDSIKAFDFTPLTKFFTSLKNAIMGIDWEGIMTAAKGALTSIGNFITAIWRVLTETFAPVLKRGQEIFQQISADMGPVFKDLGDIARLFYERMSDLFKWMETNVVPVFKSIMTVAQPIVSAIMENMLLFWGIFKDLIKAVKSLLAGDFKSVGDYLLDAGKKLWEAIKNLFSGVVEAIKTAFKPSTWFGKKEEAPATTPAMPSAGAPAKTEGKPGTPVTEDPRKAASAGTPAKEKAQEPTLATPAKEKAQEPTPPVTKEEKQADTQNRLNNINEQILATLRAIEDHHRRTLDAIKKLNPNQF